MNENLRLGRIAGVAVGINWSVLVIFTLITVGLAAGRFPLLQPGLDPLAYAVAGLVAGVVFFLSLLAHELSHAIVARRHGVGVDGITLWLFGGVARLTSEAKDPRSDFRIAAAGPAVSIVLGVGFLLLAAAANALGLAPLVVEVVIWLGVINLVLAVFNLVPAAPLDGGRLLRAALWRRSGDRVSAAVAAARAGRGFGWFLIFVGFAVFMLGAGIGGLWLVFLGWFLINAARMEEEQARVGGALSGVRVADAMTPEPMTAPDHLTVDRFTEHYVFRSRHSTFPVVDSFGRPTGLVTLRRVKEVPAHARHTTPISAIACPMDEVAVAHPDEPLEDLLPRMSACADGRSLVMVDSALVGIVSPADVMRWLEVAELRPTHRSAT